MKFEVDKTKIEQAAQKVSRVAGKHLTLPVLSCIYLEVLPQDKLVIKTTNLDMGIEITLKIKTIKTGYITVPANIFLGVISSVSMNKNNNLLIEEVGGNLKIISDKNASLIKCVPSEDFPSIPKIIDGKGIKINASDLILGFKSVWYSASNSNIKPELGSIFVYNGEGNLTFVSTDSFRLSEKKVVTKITEDFPQTLIPYKNVVEIIKVFEDYKGDIEIFFEKNQASFVVGDIYIVSRLVDGSFPDYKQIIPKEYTTKVTLLKSDLINSIKSSNIFSDNLNQVKFKVNQKSESFIVESKNNDIGEYSESIKASISGENIELNFNSRYVVDCFQSITSDSLTLNFGGPGKPLVISGVSDKSFMYIVMPMNR